MKTVIAALTVSAFVFGAVAPASALYKGNPSNPELRKDFYNKQTTKDAPDGAMPASGRRKPKKH